MEPLDKIRAPSSDSPNKGFEDPDTEKITRAENDEYITKKKRAELDDELAVQRKQREFSEEGWFYWIRLITVGTIAVLSLSVIIIYWWHLISHENAKWLSPEGVLHIEKTAIAIVVGIGGTLATTYFLKKR